MLYQPDDGKQRFGTTQQWLLYEHLAKRFTEEGLNLLYVMRLYVVDGTLHLEWRRSRLYLAVLHRCKPNHWLSEMDILIEARSVVCAL